VNRGLQAVQFQVFHRKAEKEEHLTAVLLCLLCSANIVLHALLLLLLAGVPLRSQTTTTTYSSHY
jgi:hypothetical protein